MFSSLRPHLQYGRYVLLHKLHVLRSSVKYGVWWLGLVHDNSKFDKKEWVAYAESFYGPYDKDNRPKVVKDNFNTAWRLHCSRNKHHPGYWAYCRVCEQRALGCALHDCPNKNDHQENTVSRCICNAIFINSDSVTLFSGRKVPITKENAYFLPMPARYILEMLADWEGARLAKADGSLGSSQEWYQKNGSRLPLNWSTRAMVHHVLGL